MSKPANKLEDEYEYKKEVLASWYEAEIWDHIYEVETEGGYDDDPTLKRQIRRHAIASGYYKPITDAELDRIWTYPPRKKYDFKMDGVKYTAS